MTIKAPPRLDHDSPLLTCCHTCITLWFLPLPPTQAEAGAAKMEIFSFLPQWMAESWSQAGSLGYWYPDLRGGSAGGGGGAGGPTPGGQPTAALAHMVHVPGGASNKLTVKVRVSKGGRMGCTGPMPFKPIWHSQSCQCGRAALCLQVSHNVCLVQLASGNWDWDIAHAAARAPPRLGGSGPFLASNSAAPLPDVLAYSSEVRVVRVVWQRVAYT